MNYNASIRDCIWLCICSINKMNNKKMNLFAVIVTLSYFSIQVLCHSESFNCNNHAHDQEAHDRCLTELDKRLNAEKDKHNSLLNHQSKLEMHKIDQNAKIQNEASDKKLKHDLEKLKTDHELLMYETKEKYKAKKIETYINAKLDYKKHALDKHAELQSHLISNEKELKLDYVIKVIEFARSALTDLRDVVSKCLDFFIIQNEAFDSVGGSFMGLGSVSYDRKRSKQEMVANPSRHCKEVVDVFGKAQVEYLQIVHRIAPELKSKGGLLDRSFLDGVEGSELKYLESNGEGND